MPTLFRQVVERVPDNLALRKRDNNGNNIDWTYSQYYQQVSLSLEKVALYQETNVIRLFIQYS